MTDSQGKVVLVGQSLVSFSSHTTDVERDDILDCLNYAETRADRKYDRHRFWKRWINRYQAGLYNNGFRISGALVSNTFDVTHIREVPDVIRTAIEGSGHPQLGALGRSALERMLRSSHAQSFFKEWFSSGQSETLQIVPCRQLASGEIDVMVCGIRLVTEMVEGGWFEAPTGRLQISVDGGAYRYSRDAYAPYREEVKSSIEAYAQLYFDSIDAG
jgi:hypothetical protein